MFSRIGIMQGRLLPKLNGRYQAHPIGYWQEEFWLAKQLNLDYIEFILDFNDYEQNPLMSDSGLMKISELIKDTGVEVKSVCADYFMEAPLHSASTQVAHKSMEVLLTLIENASKLGITDIVIPCVDQSSLLHADDQQRLVDNLAKPIVLAEKYKINLALETDLSPQAFSDLLSKFDTQCITVNYDVGNSAALGYDILEEFKAYGNRISDIHIKDRKLGGGSVVLGTGNANFDVFFHACSQLNFNGPVIMQVYRDEEGFRIFTEQLNWLLTRYPQYIRK